MDQHRNEYGTPPCAARCGTKRPSERRPIFVVRLRAEQGIDGIRALRAVLKSLLRRHGLRCLSAREADR